MSKFDSKYLSYILRHKPENAGITLDEYGFTDVKILCSHLGIMEEELKKIVDNNTRYVYNKDFTKIKAAHGHSVPVKYMDETEPPEYLYHGTADRFVDSIMKNGILPQSRVMVHMSSSLDDAGKIGVRHTGRSEEHLVVLKINASKMYEDGYKFYKSEDNVWLTEEVPSRYLEVL